MKILVILKGSLSKLPPVISTCLSLSDLNHSVTVFTQDSNDYIENIFKEKNINITYYRGTNLFSKIKLISKICTWLNFRRQAKEYIIKNKFDLLWIGSADTALAIGKILLQYNYIFQVHELYDTIPYYKKCLRIYMQKALKVVVPEEIRAHIFRAWYQLKETPIALPNKPYYHPRKRNLEITDKAAKEAFDKIPKNSKIIFYQGIINEERDLRPLAKAIQEIGEPLVLAIQSPEANNIYYKDLLLNYKVYKIPYVKAPKHLEITSNVDIGLIFYNHISMNTEFCAPNKIYEYSGFSLPILANDVFCLKDKINYFKAGISMNLDSFDYKYLKLQIENLLKEETNYMQGSKILFESVDTKEIIKRILAETNKKIFERFVEK